MARCEVKGIDELLQGLNDLEDIDAIANDILFECGNILEKDMKSEIRRAANRGYATGELENSIVPTAPMKNAYGHFVAVRPVGTDSKGVRNGEKLQYLQEGTKKGQQGRKGLKEVGKKSEEKCAKKAQEILNKHTKL